MSTSNHKTRSNVCPHYILFTIYVTTLIWIYGKLHTSIRNIQRTIISDFDLTLFRFFIWKCVKSRTIKKVLIPAEAKFIFCSWHHCHHHYNYYYHRFKIETLKWKWKHFLSCLSYINIKCFVCLSTLSSCVWVYVYVCVCVIKMMVLYHCDR